MAGNLGFMMFDGFQDNIMKSQVAEQEATTTEQKTEDKTIIETTGAATGGPNPEDPKDDDD